MAKVLPKKRQIRLLKEIGRLSKAGIRHKNIATQLIKYGDSRTVEVGKSCAKALEKGVAFSEGLQPFLSNQAYLALTSGEHSGNFQLGIDDAVNALNMEEASTGTLIRVLIKPIAGIISVFWGSAALAAYAYPKIEDFLPRHLWGALARASEAFGLFWLEYGYTILALFIISIVLVVVSIGRYWQWRPLIDNWPIYRQYRFIQCSNFLTSIAHQISVGTSLKMALKHYQAHSSSYLSHHISVMLKQIKKGETSIGNIFDTGLLLQSELDTLRMLSEIGEADTTLKNSAQIHSDRLLMEIDVVKTWGKNIFMVLASFIGMFQAFGLLTLVFNLALNFNRL
ncbi:hypothetical protein [Vibrio cholerae]|uniref:hypothetical protein n=1 Tax=Vibrio cholerae TaxID=666 RepID=UPI0002C1677E|nr:hypothetical protein [Vibrio cholerae]EMQ19274.1 hypothetical protein VCEC0051_003888 [Vibrio cholerae O1 str. EC-0051]EMQ61106.1 type II secretion system (T2SS), F family protein [Vibrio cholerae O1 str. EM-1727]KPA02652.1 hypothetical protein AC096_08715 [Vibrio cholerae]